MTFFLICLAVTILLVVLFTIFVTIPIQREQAQQNNSKEITMKKLLIIVDIQHDFVDGSLGSEDAQSIVPRVADKIRNWKGDVICTLDTHGANYLETKEGKMLPVTHCVEGTTGHGLVESVTRAAFENQNIVFTTLQKRTFGSTALPEIIRGMNLERIEIVGLCTDICVVSNALLLRANYPELDIAVDASCCAGTSKENHNAALTVMKQCQIEIVGNEVIS